MTRREKRVRHVKRYGRKCLIAGLLGMFLAMLLGGSASGTVTGQTYSATLSPKKEDKKKFGKVSLTSVIDTQYQDVNSQDLNSNSDQLTLTFSRDIRFSPPIAPWCMLGDIQGRFTAQAKFVCPKSVIGQGSARLTFDYQPTCCFGFSREPAAIRFANLVTADAEVTLFNGFRLIEPPGPPEIYLHFDLGPGALVLDFVGKLDTQANTLTVGQFPLGFEVTHLDLTINKLKTGKKAFYVSARCKEGEWTNSVTDHFADGSTRTAYSTQKCRRKS